MKDYLNVNDRELAAFSRTFQSGMSVLAAATNSAARADEIGTTLDDFEETLAEIDATRAHLASLINKKNDVRKKLRTMIRNSAMMLRAHEAVRDKELGMLGLKVYDRVRTGSAAPETVPTITVQIKPSGRHVVEVFDFADSTARAKPKDASGAEIWVRIGADGAALDEKNMRYLGTVTRGKMICAHDAADAGKQAFYAARWVNRRGMRGGWSNPADATIAK